MKGRATMMILAAMGLPGLLPLTLTCGTEHPASGKVYSLEEISIFDYDGPNKYQLQSGQPTTDCGYTPRDGVTYPVFQSNKPIYGTIVFDLSLFDPRSGLRYHFAIDESAGAGYDRLYFDANRDLDLTSDPPVGPAKDPPAGVRDMPDSILFESMELQLDYGPAQGVFTQAVMPRLMRSGERVYMFFTAPTARRGKIQLGPRETELILAQTHVVTGRYDRPMTAAFLTGVEDVLPFLGCWRCVDGTFYSLSATRGGDQVTVTPYAGPFGVLETGAGGRNMAAPEIEFGWLSGRNTFLDLADCPRKDGKLNLPVGDYRLFRMAVRYGQRRIGLAVDVSRLGHSDAPAAFPIVIRQDKPFVLDFPGKFEVVFKSPSPGDRVKTGQMLEVQATLCDNAAGTMISALEDTTKKTGSTELPNGRSLDMFESVSPTIRITDSSGQTVAEGVMPFG